jgi:hypothetical protein
VTVEACVQQIREQLGDAWLPRIYRERILKLRTRSYHFETANIPKRIIIQHTLLGVELKVGRKRLLCPDLATARYLLVFARLGCKDVAVPYDITKISQLADELESSWYRMLLLADQGAQTRAVRNKSASFKTRVRGSLIANIRAEITAAGAGTRIPEFKQSTRRR